MQAASIDLDAQQLLEPDIGETHIATEVIDQRELAKLVRSFEGHSVQAERCGNTIRQGAVEITIVIEEADASGRFPRLDDELDGAGIEPAVSLGDKLLHHICSEGAVVFLAQLELHFQATLLRHVYDGSRHERHVGEAFPGLNSRYADVRTEVEVSG